MPPFLILQARRKSHLRQERLSTYGMLSNPRPSSKLIQNASFRLVMTAFAGPRNKARTHAIVCMLIQMRGVMRTRMSNFPSLSGSLIMMQNSTRWCTSVRYLKGLYKKDMFDQEIGTLHVLLRGSIVCRLINTILVIRDTGAFVADILWGNLATRTSNMHAILMRA